MGKPSNSKPRKPARSGAQKFSPAINIIPAGLLKDSRCVRLEDGRILKLSRNEASLVYFEQSEFQESKKIQFPLEGRVENYQRIKCQQINGQLMVEIEASGIYVFDVSGQNLQFLKNVCLNYKGRGALISNGNLYFYNDNEPYGFQIISLSDVNTRSFVAVDDHLWIKDGIGRGKQIIFAGQDNIFVYELEQNQKLQKILKPKANFSSPKIESTPHKDHYIIFDAVSTHAISLFRFETTFKRVATFHPDVKALFWRWINDTLYVLLHDYKNKMHQVTSYSWTGDTLEHTKTLELPLRDSSGSPYVHITYTHFEENEIQIVNAEGTIWVVKN